MKNGFITLLGLMLVALIIGFWFIKMYPTAGSKKVEINTYQDAIKKAEDAKRMMEDSKYR